MPVPLRVTISKLSDYKHLEKELTRRWLEIENVPNAFRYKLNVREQKILCGDVKFLVQLNTERTALRRAPQQITSIVPPFNAGSFNFNKVSSCEIILECDDQLNRPQQSNPIITYLINNSPLTKYHSLICPNLADNLPQILTKESIDCAIDIISTFDDSNYRIGYNSPGALASVNHLHLHLMYIEQRLGIEEVKIHHLTGNIYKLDKTYPAFGLCLPLLNFDDKTKITQDLLKLIEYFCAETIPHNILWTFAKLANREVVKIFVFPRKEMCDKQGCLFNVAFCELSGYVPVGDKDVYDSLTVDMIRDNFANAMGNIETENFESDIVNLYSC